MFHRLTGFKWFFSSFFFSLYSEQKSECFPEWLTALFSHKVPSSGCWFEIAFSRIQRSLMSWQYTSPLLPSAHSYNPLLFHTFPPAVRLYETQDILCVIFRSTWLYRETRMYNNPVVWCLGLLVSASCALTFDVWALNHLSLFQRFRLFIICYLLPIAVQGHGGRRLSQGSSSEQYKSTPDGLPVHHRVQMQNSHTYLGQYDVSRWANVHVFDQHLEKTCADCHGI